MISDEQLIKKYCKGNRQAMAILIERYQDEMLNFFYRRVDSKTQAEDMVQELFLKVIRHAHRFRAKARFSTWLYRIAINLVRNFYRRPRRVSTEEAPEFWANIQDKAANFTASFELKSDLQRFMRKLKQDFQLILELTYFQDLSTDEVAKVLNLPVGTVKSRRFHALKQLDRLMQESKS